MALTPEEKAQLEQLVAKEKEDPPEDEFIEIWDDTGAGAKVKRSAAKGWLNKFGIDVEEAADQKESKESKDTKDKSKPVKREPTAARYFGNRNSA